VGVQSGSTASSAASVSAVAAAVVAPAQRAALFAQRRGNSILRGAPATNESLWYSGTFANVPSCNSVKRFTAYQASPTVRLVYGCLYGRDQLPGNAIIVRAAIDNGSVKQPVWFNGSRDVTINPGAIVVSDPVAANLVAGQLFYTRTYVTSTGGTVVPFQGSPEGLTVTAWGEGCDAQTGVGKADLTTSGSVTAGAVSHYSPIAVIWDDGGLSPLVGLRGDSVLSGIGDTGNVNAGRGFGRRALNNTIPFVSIATGGEHFVSESSISRRPLLYGCTDVLGNMGINDFTLGTPLATIQAAALADWTYYSATGARVWHCTVTPHTTSSDSWATLVNQTVGTGEANRTAFNDWLRGGAPIVAGVAVAVGTGGAILAGATGHPLSGYFETADTVESARNSGLWQVGSVYLTDAAGLHPSTTGHAAMAAAITVARFTA
jgi:hypothetical protein